MNTINLFLTLFLYIAFSNSAYSKYSNVNSESSLEKKYIAANNFLKAEKWQEAIKLLKEISLSSYSQDYESVQLDLIYAYYKQKNFSLAQVLTHNFFSTKPNITPNLDYIMYMHGLSKVAINEDKFRDFFMNTFDYNSDYISLVLHIFSNVTKFFPESRYVRDIYKRECFLNKQLSRKELAAIKYYDSSSLWLALINKAENMLSKYPNMHQTYQTLSILRKSYLSLEKK